MLLNQVDLSRHQSQISPILSKKGIGKVKFATPNIDEQSGHTPSKTSHRVTFLDDDLDRLILDNSIGRNFSIAH